MESAEAGKCLCKDLVCGGFVSELCRCDPTRSSLCCWYNHPTCTGEHICCVSIQSLHPSEEHFKADYVTTPSEGSPNPTAPPNAASFSLFLEDAPLLSFVASHIPRFFAHPKKKKGRKR